MPALRRNPFFSQNRKCAQKALRLTRSQALLFRVAAVKMRGAKVRKMLGTIVGLTINSKKITTRILFEPFTSFMLYVCSLFFFVAWLNYYLSAMTLTLFADRFKCFGLQSFARPFKVFYQ
jgi:hypothetical protein